MRLVALALAFVVSTAPVLAGGESSARPLIDSFANVVSRIQPVAVRECQRRTDGMSCDFRFILDKRSSAGANAHQTMDDNGRPVIRVTKGLIRKLRTVDELAFVLAHEAGHHIGGHLARARNTTGLDHISFASLGTEDAKQGSAAQRRAFELEADGFGAIITQRAGYNAMRGAECLARMNPAGFSSSATHPQLADRMAMVRRVLGR